MAFFRNFSREGEQFRVLMTGKGILCIVICFIRQEPNKKTYSVSWNKDTHRQLTH